VGREYSTLGEIPLRKLGDISIDVGIILKLILKK
jgi:hypothetical protein